MYLVKRLILGVLIGISIFQVSAQGTEVGFWRDHLPYDHVIGVVKSGSLIYAATPYSMYTYNLSDNSIEKLAKGNGLSDFGISRLEYNELHNTVVVGYSNGNLDLIQGNVTTNIPAIKTSSLSGDKQIYGIHCEGDFAYLATGFGIVQVNIDRSEVKDTYIIGDLGTQIKVNDVTTDATKIYAALDDGIREADLSNPFLSDFSQWTERTDVPLPTKPVTHIQEFNNRIYISQDGGGFKDDSVFAYNGIVWELDTLVSSDDNYRIRTDNGKIVFAQRNSVSIMDSVNARTGLVFQYAGNTINTFDAYYDGSKAWIATEFQGMLHAISNSSGTLIEPVGPDYTENYSFATIDGDLWVSGGTLFGNLGDPGFQQQGFYKFSEESWTTYNKYSHTAVEFDSAGAYDFLYITTDPSDPDHFFASSASELGLLEFRSGAIVNTFNKSNSTLVERTGFTDFYDLAQGHFDEDGNLWQLSSRSTSPVSVMAPDGTWQGATCASLGSSNRVTSSAMDENGRIWAAVVNVGLLAYYNNETPTDMTDDQCKILNTAVGNGDLPTAAVNCVAVDLDGEIWIGTDAGPAIIYSPSNVFDGGDYDAQQILIEQDGNVQLLLETEAIRSITIDGANRKWIGTQNSGAFLLSEDGTEQIYHFTEDNSPLISNEIRDIAINGETGEVFFGTVSGIVSFKSTATEGQTSFNDVYAYPNPVRPEYDGSIAIKGLLRDSDVKITDVSGNLVFETTSFGGQAIWDGKTYDGFKVKSGVYLVFASSESGNSSVVTKIAVIN